MSKKKAENVEDLDFSNNNIDHIVTRFEEIPFDKDAPILNFDDMPVLPLRGMVLFEDISIPVPVGRESSLKLCEFAEATKSAVVAVAQTDSACEDVKEASLYKYGVICRIVKTLSLPDGTVSAFLHCSERARISKLNRKGNFLRAKVTPSPTSVPKPGPRINATIQIVQERYREFLDLLDEENTRELRFTLSQYDNPIRMINFICSNAPFDFSVKQELLEERDFQKRMELLLYHLDQALQLFKLKVEIGERTHSDLSRQQKENFLMRQMDVIQNELGNSDEEDIRELNERSQTRKWNEAAQARYQKELKKLQRLNPSNPEYAVQYGYLDTFLNLPWGNYSEEEISISNVRNVLDRDHYGLEKVKERILEHIAVLKLRKDMKAPILCLFGPPGVGKTSLGRSVAESLGREYARISLGGIHDEAEIRGHRRTYLGSMPGRVISALEKCGTGNPVIVLDEIDKIGKDHKGDPSTALLEVLDPEQNFKFHDNYVDFDYDLSKVLFLATANSLSTISAPLLDRMEIIDISGYITEEKIEIATRHLVPKELDNNGFEAGEVEFTREALVCIIEHYTRESGVRTLEKKIAKVLRKLAVKKASEEEFPGIVDETLVRTLLGKEEVSKDIYETNEFTGVVTGLAWTSVGGEILFIESSLSKGKGGLTLTGNLGDVMKESATLALQYLKAHASDLGIDSTIFAENDFHVHVPEGAIPKDGPSAGVTMVTSLASTLTGRKVRDRLAMTGEITLRGKVLPVGGIKEKILAAKRAGISDIMLCEDNRKDIDEIPEIYLQGLTFHYVKRISEVLEFALL